MGKLTPRQAARAQCQQCLGMDQFNRNEVQDCKGDTCHAGPCPLFPYRMGKRIPVKVFRPFCLQCMGGSVNFVRECETMTCPVHPYRMGKNPAKMGRKPSTAQLSALRERHSMTKIQARETTIRPERGEMVTEGEYPGEAG